VNEIGSRIISDAPSAQREGGVSKAGRLNPRQANIDGFRFHVQALLRYSGSVGPQEFVGLRSTVTANDLYFGAGTPARPGQIEQNVEEVRIKVMHIAGQAVTQESVQLHQSIAHMYCPADKRRRYVRASACYTDVSAALHLPERPE